MMVCGFHSSYGDLIFFFFNFNSYFLNSENFIWSYSHVSSVVLGCV